MVTFLLYSLLAIPILFPINTINQGSLSGLNYLTMGNVTDDVRTWAHCLLACILSGKISYSISRKKKLITHSHTLTLTYDRFGMVLYIS